MLRAILIKMVIEEGRLAKLNSGEILYLDKSCEDWNLEQKIEEVFEKFKKVSSNESSRQLLEEIRKKVTFIVAKRTNNKAGEVIMNRNQKEKNDLFILLSINNIDTIIHEVLHTFLSYSLLEPVLEENLNINGELAFEEVLCSYAPIFMKEELQETDIETIEWIRGEKLKIATNHYEPIQLALSPVINLITSPSDGNAYYQRMFSIIDSELNTPGTLFKKLNETFSKEDLREIFNLAEKCLMYGIPIMENPKKADKKNFFDSSIAIFNLCKKYSDS